MAKHCSSSLHLPALGSSSLVISAVNTLILVFILQVPVEPGNGGAVKKCAGSFEATNLCLV